MNGSIEHEDLEILAAQMGGQEALYRIIDMYTGRLPAEVAELHEYLDSDDLAGIQASAHRLKSSSGQLGASRLAVMLAGLEHAGREGDREAATRILAEISVEAENARTELTDLTSGP